MEQYIQMPVVPVENEERFSGII